MDPVTICNIALGLLGANKITSIDPDEADSAEAELCARLFEPTVKAVLEAKAWLFATGFIDLGAPVALEDGEVRPYELPAKFKLPTTVVRVLACDDGTGEYTIKWERNDECVISEETDKLNAKVVIYNADPKRWTPTFCRAVAYLLAADLAGPVTENASKGERMFALYEREVKKAGTFDGMQGNTVQEVKIKSHSLANRR